MAFLEPPYLATPLVDFIACVRSTLRYYHVAHHIFYHLDHIRALARFPWIRVHIVNASEYEKRKGSQVARHHIKDHRAKQLLVVPNDDKFVAVAAPEAFSRHSGTCMILGGQVTLTEGNCVRQHTLDKCIFHLSLWSQNPRFVYMCNSSPFLVAPRSSGSPVAS